MKVSDFITSIRKSMELFDSAGMIRTTASLRPLPVSIHFRKVALDSSSKYEQIFHAGLELSHYNFLLKDYSYFQFSLFDGKRLDMRYAFYPNPYSNFSPDYRSSLDRAMEDGSLTFEEYSQLLTEEEVFNILPNIRYDVSEKQYSELTHPYSHLTIGRHSDNRWPVSFVLTPYMFSLLLLKYFYRSKFEMLGKKQFERREILYADCEIIAESGNCRRISDEFFSELEKRQPHWVNRL